MAVRSSIANMKTVILDKYEVNLDQYEVSLDKYEVSLEKCEWQNLRKLDSDCRFLVSVEELHILGV